MRARFPYALGVALGSILVLGACVLTGLEEALAGIVEIDWYLTSSPWSPDGRHLLVLGGDGFQSVAVESGEPLPLSCFASACPSFSPDGSAIALEVYDVGPSEECEVDSLGISLWIAEPDGSLRTEIARWP